MVDSVKLAEETKHRFEKSAHGADIMGSPIKGTVTKRWKNSARRSSTLSASEKNQYPLHSPSCLHKILTADTLLLVLM